jgi:hypothetical protein
MSATGVAAFVFPIVFAIHASSCAPAVVRTEPVAPVVPAALWENPADLAERDLLYGPWGAERAPQPDAIYTFVRLKEGGTSPGLVVRDPRGREWNVKQPSHSDRGDEGPAEVVLSRVLSAIGYRQPAVYYLPSLTMRDAFGTRVVPGGRFRLRDPKLKERDPWSWQRNPYVGTRPFEGLLVILMMFRSSDLKNANNSLYEFRRGDLVEHWYVVRDLGAALGETGRLSPFRNNAALFERGRVFAGRRGPFVVFDYRGRHQELVRDRITPEDVFWAASLLNRLSTAQWFDAFRAGGYDAAVASRFIRKLRATIDEGLAIERR